MRYELQGDIKESNCYAIIGRYETIEDAVNAYINLENKSDYDKFIIQDNETGNILNPNDRITLFDLENNPNLMKDRYQRLVKHLSETFYFKNDSCRPEQITISENDVTTLISVLKYIKE